MNSDQYRQWRFQAEISLLGAYSLRHTEFILSWFDGIRAEDERALTGPAIQECLRAIRSEMGEHWNLHNDLNMRLWLYAPYILAQIN